LKNRILWIVLAGVIAGAVVAVVFHAGRNDRQGPAKSKGSKQPDSDTINRATGAALKVLSECMRESPPPQCKERPVVRFIFSARGGGGRILDLTLEKGWLDPDLFACWKKSLEKTLVPAPDQTGKVNVQYPLACDEKGMIHIRPPVLGGSISKKNLHKR
jgi:hypothetical protein